MPSSPISRHSDSTVALTACLVPGGDTDASDIEQHVQPTVAFRHSPDHDGGLCLVGDVGLYGERLATGIADARGQAIKPLPAPRRDGHGGSFRRQPQRGCRADARGGAGRQSDFSIEFPRVRCFCSGGDSEALDAGPILIGCRRGVSPNWVTDAARKK